MKAGRVAELRRLPLRAALQDLVNCPGGIAGARVCTLIELARQPLGLLDPRQREIEPLCVCRPAELLETRRGWAQQVERLLQVAAGVAEIHVVEVDASRQQRAARLEQIDAQGDALNLALRRPPAGG